MLAGVTVVPADNDPQFEDHRRGAGLLWLGFRISRIVVRTFRFHGYLLAVRRLLKAKVDVTPGVVALRNLGLFELVHGGTITAGVLLRLLELLLAGVRLRGRWCSEKRCSGMADMRLIICEDARV
jgi:hypothetical protein